MLSIIQLEQIHLNRCTIKETTVTLFNFMFLRRFIGLTYVDIVLKHLILALSFSLDYNLNELTFVRNNTVEYEKVFNVLRKFEKS